MNTVFYFRMGRVKTSYDNIRILASQAGNQSEEWEQIQEADAMKQVKLVLQLFTLQWSREI